MLCSASRFQRSDLAEDKPEREKRFVDAAPGSIAELLGTPDPLLDLPEALRRPLSRNEDGEYCGRLITHPVAGGKRLQACSLWSSNGEKVIISYRPVPAYFPFEGKQVAIVGELSNPALENPDRQAVYGWHLEVTSIRLVDGESPHAPAPTTLPPPPRLDSLASLRACTAPYGRVVGALLGGTLERHASAAVKIGLSDGVLTLSDLRLTTPPSGQLRALLASSSPSPPDLSASVATERDMSARLAIGGVVTVIVSLTNSDPRGLSICPGDVTHCGCGHARSRSSGKLSPT